MSRVLALLLLVTPASAEPARTPYVVAYEPPAVVERDHRGLTLEVAVATGATPQDGGAGGATFAIGGWLSRDLSLAFRATSVGAFHFAGGSAQYVITPALWFGAGLGQLSERGMDADGFTTRSAGLGGFARVGYQLAGSRTHALYVSVETQVGGIDDQALALGLIAIGYQLQ